MFPESSRSGQHHPPRELTSPDRQVDSKEQELLNEVLQQTQSLTSGDQPLDPQEMEALRNVARKHVGSALSLDVATDLVRALYSIRWAKPSQSPINVETMSRQVAESLMEHPASLDRLGRLWNRLGEATR